MHALRCSGIFYHKMYANQSNTDTIFFHLLTVILILLGVLIKENRWLDRTASLKVMKMCSENINVQYITKVSIRILLNFMISTFF